jgi:hypothetical protein
LLLGACSPPDCGAVQARAGTAAATWAPPAAAGPAPAPVPHRDSILAMQAALDAWFTALSTIAADGLVRLPEDPLVAEAGQAALLDAPAGRAVAAIGGLLVTASRGKWRAQREAALAGRAAARNAYVAVLGRIGEGQALLLERAAHLSQEETARQVRAAEAALRQAAALLPRGAA